MRCFLSIKFRAVRLDFFAPDVVRPSHFQLLARGASLDYVYFVGHAASVFNSTGRDVLLLVCLRRMVVQISMYDSTSLLTLGLVYPVEGVT
jgi:hypothetical protein